MFSCPGRCRAAGSRQGLKYGPKHMAAKTATVYERAQEALLRRTIWKPEFSFKPSDDLIDVPQGQRRNASVGWWYPRLSCSQLGTNLKPKGLVKSGCGGSGLQNRKRPDEEGRAHDPTVRLAKELYEEVQGINCEVEVVGQKNG